MPTEQQPTTNKEQVYDEQISPLMAQILDICQKNGIAMIASFAIPTPADPDLHCSSMQPDETGKNPDSHLAALRALRGAPSAFAMTVTTTKN